MLVHHQNLKLSGPQEQHILLERIVAVNSSFEVVLNLLAVLPEK
jgi:ABC-type phosphate transport system ATPase subunit